MYSRSQPCTEICAEAGTGNKVRLVEMICRIQSRFDSHYLHSSPDKNKRPKSRIE